MQTFWSELGYVQLAYREPREQAIPLSKYYCYFQAAVYALPKQLPLTNVSLEFPSWNNYGES